MAQPFNLLLFLYGCVEWQNTLLIFRVCLLKVLFIAAVAKVGGMWDKKVFMYNSNLSILPFNKFQCNPSSLPILDTLPSWPMPCWIPVLERNMVRSSQILFIPVPDNLLPCMCSKCMTYLGDKVLRVFRYLIWTWNGWRCRLVSIWKFWCRLDVTRLRLVISMTDSE